MATKQFVGPVDCYAAALPDEEYMMFLARDPIAPWLVSVWASMRVGDFKAASANFQRMFGEGLLDFYKRNPDTAKSQEAIGVAQRMISWRAENVNGPNGIPRWKDSRAIGVERFVTEYLEYPPGGPAIAIRTNVEDWPLWARPLMPPVILPPHIAEGQGQEICSKCQEFTCECDDLIDRLIDAVAGNCDTANLDREAARKDMLEVLRSEKGDQEQ